MEAIRETAVIEDHVLTLRLPDSFNAKRIEVIVLALTDEQVGGHSQSTRRRSPSAKLSGTRVLDDLIVSAVANADWEALA